MKIVSTLLDSEKYPDHVVNPNNAKLILLDGREIELYPKKKKQKK